MKDRHSFAEGRIDIDEVYMMHVGTVYKVCFTYMRGNKMDLEDAVSETFIKFIKQDKVFASHEHIKAWLIVTASNTCKDMLKKNHRNDIPFDEKTIGGFSHTENDALLSSLLLLPENQKISLYLYYYENYSAKEIAKIINKKQSTVWLYLSEGRNNLKSILKEDLS